LGLAQAVVVVAFIFQTYFFATGVEPTISFEDGVNGLSAQAQSDAQEWLAENYDGGLVLMDDFSRTISIIHAGLPMDQVIYIGNAPYWEESLAEPERHARWIVMQEHDAIWNELYINGDKLGRVYAHFALSYTSPEILIFRRTSVEQAGR
jgi:hypothetical protein